MNIQNTRIKRKYKVEGGVKKQRFYRMLRKEVIRTNNFFRLYKNNEYE